MSIRYSESRIYQCGDILLHSGDSADIEFLFQHFEDVGRKESRESRTGIYVAHSKIEEVEKNNDRFLLIPCDIENNREIIDILHLESIF